MADALIALHFQNDICHPEGRIPFSLNRSSADAEAFLDGKPRGARRRRAPHGWTIIHVHIAFAEDYSDLPRNCRLFSRSKSSARCKRGSWGAAPLAAFRAGGRGRRSSPTLAIARFGRTRPRRALLRDGASSASHVNGARHAVLRRAHGTRRRRYGVQVTVLADCCASGAERIAPLCVRSRCWRKSYDRASGEPSRPGD